MYKAILEGLKPGPIVFVDDQHIVRYMNDIAIKKFVKQEQDDLIGKSIFECHEGQSIEKIKHYFEEMQAGRLESINVRKKGHIQGVMQVVKDEQGKVIGYIERHEVIQNRPIILKENGYEKAAKYYDIIMDSKDLKDIEFYKQFIGSDKAILEFGCGTGRVGLNLALMGNLVHGVDFSDEMIGCFNKKIVNNLSAFTKEIKTFSQPLLTYMTDYKYDYIIFSHQVFQTLFSESQRREALEKALSMLKPGGKIIVDVYEPTPSIFEAWAQKCILDAELQYEDGSHTIKRYLVGKQHFEKQQIISFLHRYEIYKEGQLVEQFEEPMRLAYQYDPEMRTMFSENGLKVEASFSDWEGTHIEDMHKENLIYILSKL